MCKGKGGHEKERQSTEAMGEQCGEWEMQWASYQRACSIRALGQRGLCVHVCEFIFAPVVLGAAVLQLGVRTPHEIT